MVKSLEKILYIFKIKLVKQSMQEGAMGLATSLIYAPGSYADIEELIELSKVASQYNGGFVIV